MKRRIQFSSFGRQANTYSFSRRAASRLVIQILALIIIVLVERVVGLPIFFLGMYVQAMDQVSGRFQYGLTFVMSLLLGVVYQISFVTSFFMLLTGLSAWALFTNFGSSKTARVVVSALASAVCLVILSRFEFTFRVVLYGALSTFFVMVMTRLSATQAKPKTTIFDLT